MTRIRFTMVAALGLALAPTVAMGGPPDPGGVDAQGRAQAEVLFQEGNDLLDAGRAAEACPKLQAAVDLAGAEALGGKLVLARCYERMGRTASAWGLYREVATRATGAGQAERAAEAEARASALGSRLHHLELEVPEAALAEPTLVITIDGRSQPRASLSARLPIDPGEHSVRLTVTGRSPQEATVLIPEGPGVTRLALAEPGVERAPDATPSVPDNANFWSGARIAGLTIGIVGIAGVGAGAVVGALAKSSYDDAFTTGSCTGSPPICDDASGIDDARVVGDVGTAVFFAGAGVAVIGLVVFIVSPTEEPSPDAVSVSLVPRLSSFSAHVRF